MRERMHTRAWHVQPLIMDGPVAIKLALMKYGA